MELGSCVSILMIKVEVVLMTVSLKEYFSFFRIERSRAIVPALINAIKKCPSDKEINLNYFYDLLFTRFNLKLVHIICHDKQEHLSKKCNPKYVYVSKKRLMENSKILNRKVNVQKPTSKRSCSRIKAN